MNTSAHILSRATRIDSAPPGYPEGIFLDVRAACDKWLRANDPKYKTEYRGFGFGKKTEAPK